MAFIASDLDIVEEAIRRCAAGKRVTELRFSDRMVRYESATMRELMALRETIQRELSQTSPKQRRFVVRHAGKGMF